MAKSNYKQPNTICWDQGTSQKRLNDFRIYKLIKKNILHKSTVRMLSFPAAGWCFERGLISLDMKGTHFRMVGIEKDKNVYRKAKAMSKVLATEYPDAEFTVPDYTCTLAQYLVQLNDERFDIVYADWMGTWSRDKRHEVELMFAFNTLRKNSLLIITIMLPRGNKETMDELRAAVKMKGAGNFITPLPCCSENYVLKTKGVSNLIESIAAKYGRKIELLHFNEYQCFLTPELSFVFRVS